MTVTPRTARRASNEGDTIEQGGCRMTAPDDDVPPLITYMTTRQPKRRDAAFLRTYAVRVRDGSAPLWEIPSTVAGTLEAIAQRIEHRATNQENLGAAMWAAIDVVKAHVGPFANWPDALKTAFSAAVIDADQTLTEAEIRHTQELAAKYGWERETDAGDQR